MSIVASLRNPCLDEVYIHNRIFKASHNFVGSFFPGACDLAHSLLSTWNVIPLLFYQTDFYASLNTPFMKAFLTLKYEFKRQPCVYISCTASPQVTLVLQQCTSLPSLHCKQLKRRCPILRAFVSPQSPVGCCVPSDSCEKMMIRMEVDLQ